VSNSAKSPSQHLPDLAREWLGEKWLYLGSPSLLQDLTWVLGCELAGHADS
jgi:hypothetical protein